MLLAAFKLRITTTEWNKGQDISLSNHYTTKAFRRSDDIKFYASLPGQYFEITDHFKSRLPLPQGKNCKPLDMSRGGGVPESYWIR